MSNPVTVREIPDGLCDHLHQQFGGRLEATPADNPLGHSRDSHFKVFPERVVIDDEVHQAVIAYYNPLSRMILSRGNLCFEVRLKNWFRLWVSISNFSADDGRVLCNVSEMR